MSLDKFAVFITTHGRPDSVLTYDTLRRCGYTGPMYIIIDNEDKKQEEYKRRFGDEVVVFDKREQAASTDTADNLDDRRAVVFARNACYDIAERLGIEWFLQMDDDYGAFSFKFDSEKVYKQRMIRNADAVLSATLDYFQGIPAYCIAYGQGGDYIGGGESKGGKTIGTKRKVMNTFFLSTHRRFDFYGRMNDDVNAYLSHGIRGKLMFTIMQVMINQQATQRETGGMTDIYTDSGTYQKSFYSILYAPSCVKIYIIGEKHKRIHHFTTWDNAVPKLISEKYKKGEKIDG